MSRAVRWTSRAANFPVIFPRVPGRSRDEIRRGLIRKYGYWVIYEVRSEDILVLSLWHGARGPEGWKR